MRYDSRILVLYLGFFLRNILWCNESILSSIDSFNNQNSLPVSQEHITSKNFSENEKNAAKHGEAFATPHLLKARSLLLTNHFDEALALIEEILAADPQNQHAIAIENFILNQKQSEENISLSTPPKITFEQKSPIQQTRQALLSNVDTTWSLPKVTVETSILPENLDPTDPLLNRLHQIVIPKIAFQQTPLLQAIDTIVALAEQYDSGTNGEIFQGVNILAILDSNTPEPTVTFNLKNMPLDKILHFIAKSTGYQFDIEDDVIVFRKSEGNFSENFVTQFFNISRSAVIRMTGIDSNATNRSNTTSPETAPLLISQEESLIKEFLQKSGVNFSNTPGSNLAFDGSQLIITQSYRNLKRVQEILTRYEQTRQVEIEIKFIEVQQGALDELQFNWSFANNTTPVNRHLKNLSFGTSKEGNPSLRTLGDAFTAKNASSGDGSIVLGTTVSSTGALIPAPKKTTKIPNSTPTAPGGLNLGLASSNLFDFTGVISNKFDLGLTLRALEQQSGTDLMSAPKLTVLSGKTAKITVAQEFIYPTTYGAIESEVGSSSRDSAGVTITAGTPSDFETRNIGVEMVVTPIVEENNCISLQLCPKVTEFEGFVEYGGRSIAIQGNTTVDVPPGFYQPIFSTREIQTEVTIYDGATVVMGGLTREEIREVHDKVPFLGDIPLLGKLFRSKGETNQKKNLLIFVTANILSPGGVPIRKDQESQKKMYQSGNHDLLQQKPSPKLKISEPHRKKVRHSKRS